MPQVEAYGNLQPQRIADLFQLLGGRHDYILSRFKSLRYTLRAQVRNVGNKLGGRIYGLTHSTRHMVTKNIYEVEMPRFLIKAEVISDWTVQARRFVEFEFEAEDERSARKCIHEQFESQFGEPDFSECDRADSYVLEDWSVNPIENGVQQIKEKPYRCEMTPDIFEALITEGETNEQ